MSSERRSELISLLFGAERKWIVYFVSEKKDLLVVCAWQFFVSWELQNLDFVTPEIQKNPYGY